MRNGRIDQKGGNIQAVSGAEAGVTCLAKLPAGPLEKTPFAGSDIKGGHPGGGGGNFRGRGRWIGTLRHDIVIRRPVGKTCIGIARPRKPLCNPVSIHNGDTGGSLAIDIKGRGTGNRSQRTVFCPSPAVTFVASGGGV